VTDVAFDAETVLAALQTVLASATFAKAPRCRDLLAFATTETVAGRGHLLNERVIARAALGRPISVDTRIDASARVQAWRTRELLDRYYATEGREADLRIAIPLGQYATTAQRANTANTLAPRSRPATAGPVLTVLQLRHDADALGRRVAVGLSESLVQTLSGFPGLQVIGPVLPGGGGEEESAALHAQRTEADAVLHGAVLVGDEMVRVAVHLADARTGTVRWSSSFENQIADFTGFDAEDAIVRQVVGVVGDFGGLVLRERFEPKPGQGDPSVADALWRYYAFMDHLDPEEAFAVIDGLERAHELEPDNAHVMASLGFTFTVDVLMRGSAATDSMAIAERYGRMALAADPLNAVAHNVLAVVALARGQFPSAARHAEEALSQARLHPGNAYVAAMVIGASVDWQRGIAIIRDVVRLNPYGPNHRHTLLATDALIRNDIAQALAEACLLDFPAHLYGPLLRALCLDALGLHEQAREELDAAVALQPDLLERPAEVLASAPTIPQLAADHLAERLAALAGRGELRDISAEA
jgi:TolB-like protein/tetratricopeptide (TPR) repeat protein